MNLAVHGLEGDIVEANTFYEDPHRLQDGRPLWGNCDFVMANPPFNVDMVDAERAKGDPRLPFGLPGITKSKAKKDDKNTQKNKAMISNGNYLWISYFHSYLNATGRAGFVMSSQASSAGHSEKEVRRKLVETGDVDVMIAIRSNFFYTRTVPCELWHFDRAKPDARKDQLLMLDARSIYRKVTRKIYDFSPEQLANLTAIVWLYRGQGERFTGLVKDYLGKVCDEALAIPAELDSFENTLVELREQLSAFVDSIKNLEAISPVQQAALAEALSELVDVENAYVSDRTHLIEGLSRFRSLYETALPVTNLDQHSARIAFEPLADKAKGLVKQLDLLYKLVARGAQLSQETATIEAAAEFYDRRLATKRLKQLDEVRKQAVTQLKLAVYFQRQIVWLQQHFPDATMSAVPGLCKVVNRAEIEAADWSLTPGRFVGVAPIEVDEDFDFEQTIQDIHIELKGLNAEAVELAARIEQNFSELF